MSLTRGGSSVAYIPTPNLNKMHEPVKTVFKLFINDEFQSVYLVQYRLDLNNNDNFYNKMKLKDRSIDSMEPVVHILVEEL